jgi:TatD DNase family protein
MITLSDTHTHLYLPEFDNDRNAMIHRAFEAGVTEIYLPNVDSETISPLHALVDTYPQNCFPMMGLHPCSVKSESMENELALVKHWLDTRDYVAVGEIGLDLYWDKTTLDIQIEALKRQCEWAIEKELPVVLHCRESTAESIDVIRPFAERGLKGVFHCFSGTLEEAKMAIEMDFFLGIGGVLTFKKSGLAEIVSQIPLEYLVLETDAPYLAPVPFRGKRNESAYIRNILEALSDIRRIGKNELAEITTTNARRLFKRL